MDRRKLLRKRLVALLILLAVLCVAAGLWAQYAETLFPPPLASPPIWRGIIPGQTYEQEAVRLIGVPDQTEQRGEYVVYVYKGKQDLGWEVVELWLQPRNAGRVVVGIFRDWPYPSSDVQSLSDLGLQREHPDRTYWASTGGYRYLLWPRQGIAALLEALPSSPWNLPVLEVLLFEPMGAGQLAHTQWPWPRYGPGWAASNWTLKTSHPDTGPQDPYDWEPKVTP